MSYKGIIFDLDGVICFTDHYHYLAWKKMADSMGIPFDEKKNDRLRGVSRMESLEIILEEYHGTKLSDEEKSALAAQKNDYYREYLKKMTKDDLKDEVKATLYGLKSTGLLLAIGSSSRNAPLILERIGLDGFFDAVSDGNNIIKSKPDPEVFEKAAAMLKLKPDECLVVEDAEAGIDAAAAGGFDSAGIGAAASSSKATYAMQSFSDLIRIVCDEKKR